MRPPLIHIGYPKTGSTWLQKYVTSAEALGFRPGVERGTVRRLIIEPNELWYDREAPAEALRARFEDCEGDGLVPVITHERLAGNPISGGYDAAAIARRLHGLLPEGRVLMVVREQRSHLHSIYNEYVAGGGVADLDHFLSPPEGAQIPLFDLRYLEFDRLIRLYQALFGTGQVLVLPYELLREDAVAFCNRILQFVGLDPLIALEAPPARRSVGPYGVALRRRLNRVLQKNRLNPAGIAHLENLGRWVRVVDRYVPPPLQRRAKGRLRARIEERLGRRFAKSNSRTAVLSGLDLGAYGYPVASLDQTKE